VLTSLSLKNFKSWREIDDLQFAPITGLFGANSSGKTSILQMLLLLKQTVESSDRSLPLDFGDENSDVQLGTLRDVQWNHEDQPVSWHLRWRLAAALNIPDPDHVGETLFRGDVIGQQTEIARARSGRPTVRRLAYDFAEHSFELKRKGNAAGYELLASTQDNFRLRRTRGRAWDLPEPYKSYGFPDQINTYFQNAAFLSDFVLEFERLFERVRYLGPLREHPRRQYTWGGAQPEDVGVRGERVVDALLSARAQGLKINVGRGRKHPLLEVYVADWLQRLGLIAHFSVHEVAEGSNLYQVRVRRSRTSSEVLLTDVGFGVSQILPIIVLLFYAPKSSIVILEQPEIHLHPAVQAGLADVIIDAVQKRGVQVILESHSEHLLQRLQRRIAEEKVSHTDVALYFSDFAEDQSQLTTLDVDLFGNIRNWPSGFFGDPMAEMSAMTRAASTRKLRAGRES
jgi:predicted ATPase